MPIQGFVLVVFLLLSLLDEGNILASSAHLPLIESDEVSQTNFRAQDGLLCKFYVSENFSDPNALISSSDSNGIPPNVSSGYQKCHPKAGCAAMWIEEDNQTIVYLQGCWLNCDVFENEDERSCIATSSRRGPPYTESMFCCCKSSFCNVPENFMFRPDLASKSIVTDTEESTTWHAVVYIMMCILLACSFLSIVGFQCYKRRHSCSKGAAKGDWSQESEDLLLKFGDFDDLNILDAVFTGRYSTVHKAVRKNQPNGPFFAVKAFSVEHIKEFRNEYQTFCYPYMAAESSIVNLIGIKEGGNESAVGAYWLITEWMGLGSLHDFLKGNCVAWHELTRMGESIARGLAFLHSEIGDAKGLYKPGIAHRDVNSKNILVKEDMSCCICDFGLALSFESINKSFDAKEEVTLQEVGTIRYMAPEILDGAVNLTDSENALRQIDVYGLGLALWELISRCKDIYHSCGEPVPTFQLAYEKEAGLKPSLEQMQVLVCKRKARPLLPKPFHQKSVPPVFSMLSECLEHCWDLEAEARISAQCVAERLREIERLRPISESVTSASDNIPGACLEVNNFGSSRCGSTIHSRSGRAAMFGQDGSSAATTVTSGFGSSLSDDSPLQPYQGKNPCLERNLHNPEISNESGIVMRSTERKVDPLQFVSENFPMMEMVDTSTPSSTIMEKPPSTMTTPAKSRGWLSKFVVSGAKTQQQQPPSLLA